MNQRKSRGAPEAFLRTALIMLLLLSLGSGANTAGAAQLSQKDLTTLISVGIGDDAVIAKIEKDGVGFQVDEQSLAALRAAGASEAVLAAVKKAGAAKTAVPTAQDQQADLVVIVDNSARMGETMADGQFRLHAARQALAGAITALPNGVGLSFIVFGESAAVARPLSPINDAAKDEMIGSAAKMTAKGKAPLAEALRVAGRQLEKGDAARPGLILVITAGLDTAEGNPAEVAAQLANMPKLKHGVHVIGLNVNDDERAALQHLAATGKGKYNEARSADELTALLAPKTTVTPVVVASGRRAIKVAEPKFALPAMKSIVLARPDASPGTLSSYEFAATAKYGQEIRIPSADKLDVWWVSIEGMPICMIKNFAIAERSVIEVKPEAYLGMLQVKGEGLPQPKAIVLTPSDKEASGGTVYAYAMQSCDAYGKSMVVPAGAYDVWVVPADNSATMPLEKKLTIEAGKLIEIE